MTWLRNLWNRFLDWLLQPDPAECAAPEPLPAQNNAPIQTAADWKARVDESCRRADERLKGRK